MNMQITPPLPTFPKISSLEARALARLINGVRFTHLDFQHASASYRLANYIYNLRHKYDWPVITANQRGKTKDIVPRHTDYARYHLDEVFLKAHQNTEFGERMRKFAEAVMKYESSFDEKEKGPEPVAVPSL